MKYPAIIFSLNVIFFIIITSCSHAPPPAIQLLPSEKNKHNEVSASLAGSEEDHYFPTDPSCPTFYKGDFHKVLGEILTTKEGEELEGSLEALFDEYRQLIGPIDQEEAIDIATRELHNILLEVPETTTALERERIKKSVEEEIASMEFDVPIVINEEVENCIEYFCGEAKPIIERGLIRSGKYIDMLKKKLTENGLPRDLAYLVLIESAYNPHARSCAKAIGLWQFISGTGKRYGLKYDWWVDERKNPEKATDAAIKYLKDMYDEFGDWYLVLAGYNCGEGRVRRAINKTGVRNFWELSSKKLFPLQTRNYVPAFIAAVLISKQPEKFGFNIEYELPYEYDVVTIDKCLDLKVAAKCANTTYEHLKELNPELRRWCTPANAKNYQLRVPKGSAQDFLKAYEQVPPEKHMEWTTHKVEKNESLWTISRMYNTTPQAIASANNLSNPRLIREGRVLIIPAGEGYNGQISYDDYEESKPSKPAKSYINDNGETIHIVRSGETLSHIAKRYKVSVAKLKELNNLSSDFIYNGQKLIVAKREIFTTAKTEKPEILPNMTIMENSSSVIIYLVKEGDTLWNIANSYNVNVENLRRWNGLSEDSHIYPGDKLTIRLD